MSSQRKHRRRFGAVRKLPSGRFQASYVHEGKRLSAPITFAKERLAHEWLTRTEAAIIEGHWRPDLDTTITLHELGRRWLENDHDKRASSALRDKTILKQISPSLGDKRVTAVTRSDIQEQVNTWRIDPHGKPRAASTLGRMHSTLRTVFNYARDLELVTINPAMRIRLPNPTPPRRKLPEPGELYKLAEALGKEQALFMWLGAIGGLRWAEVAGLRTTSISGNLLTVDGQLSRERTIEPTKTASGVRTLALPEWLAIEILEVSRGKRELIFTDSGGDGISYTNWRRRTWLPACEKAGLSGLRFHDLRAMAATALISSGASIKTTQARLGHSSPHVTLALYARATSESDALAAAALGEIFTKPVARILHDSSSSEALT